MAGLVFMTARIQRLGWQVPVATANSQERDRGEIHEADVRLESNTCDNDMINR